MPEFAQPERPARRAADRPTGALSAAPAAAGRALALQRAGAQPRRAGRLLARVTPGQVVIDSARTWLDQSANVKRETDVLHAALAEIKRGKSVGFNRTAGKARLANALTVLGKSGDVAAAEADWDWLVDNRTAGAPAYAARERAFFARFETPLAALSAKHPGSLATYWLKNTPPQVMDEIVAAAGAEMPADQLYAYAAIEGLIDYVRAVLGLTGDKTAEPTPAQLATVGTAIPFSGFGFLGVDDFWLDLNAPRVPLSGVLPPGYDLSLLGHESAMQEPTPQQPHGRLVDSAVFPNLKLGMQAMAASLKRRRRLFRDDAARLGYATPTDEELVYWTYVYWNPGENNGQLEKYRGQRGLSDWIARGEYADAQQVLKSWRMIRAMAIF